MGKHTEYDSSAQATSLPSLSVVIPTCDRPELLQDALRCVLAQTLLPVEILVVDNGSRPVELAPESPLIRLITIEPFAGAAYARNVGCENAEGDYVAFLDDDDLWEQDYLRKVACLARDTDADMIVTRLDKLERQEVRRYRDVSSVPDLTEQVLVTNPGVGGPNTIVKRKAFIAVGGYDPELVTSEDRALYVEFVRRNLKVVAAGHIQAIARDPGGSRLTEPTRMVEGKRRFLRKYASLMTPAVKHENLARIHYISLRARFSPPTLFRVAWHLMLSRLSRLWQ